MAEAQAANRDATNDMNARTVESIQAEARQRAAAFALKERNTLFTAKREASDPGGFHLPPPTPGDHRFARSTGPSLQLDTSLTESAPDAPESPLVS